MMHVAIAVLIAIGFGQPVLAKSSSCPTKTPYCVAEAPANPKLHCEAHGYLVADYKSVGKACGSLLEQCRNACLADNQCLAFWHDTDTGACRLYLASSEEAKFKKGPKKTIFYDKKCFSFHKLDTSNLVFQATTDTGDDNNTYPAFVDRAQESLTILGPLDSASSFTLDPTSGSLSTVDENGVTHVANQNDSDFGQELYFNTQDEIDSGDYRKAVCNLSPSLVLRCDTGHGRKIMFDDGGVVALASPTDAAGYPRLTLTATC